MDGMTERESKKFVKEFENILDDEDINIQDIVEKAKENYYKNKKNG